ncbi:hypothetical protein B0H13DRAFT_1854910 [Mycena leptocephala]|nr:hypothetical protein B0H13DRAFT_1854910 [Mycena leptocephala]
MTYRETVNEFSFFPIKITSRKPGIQLTRCGLKRRSSGWSVEIVGDQVRRTARAGAGRMEIHHARQSVPLIPDADSVVRSYLSSICVATEKVFIKGCTSAVEVYETLHRRHTQRGPKFLTVKYTADLSTASATSTMLTELNDAAWTSGSPDPDSFLLAGMLLALSLHHPEFEQIASAATSENGGFTFITSTGASAAAAAPSPAPPAVFAAQSGSAPPGASKQKKKQHCVTPSCPTAATHTWPYCAARGGGINSLC